MIKIIRDVTHISEIYSKTKTNALLVTDGINNSIITYPEGKYTESQIQTILQDCEIIIKDNHTQVVFKQK